MPWLQRLAAGLAAALIAATALAPAALAQGFPARSLEALAAADLALARAQKKDAQAGDLLFIPGAESGARAGAVYAGQSRPVAAGRQAFILTFASSAKGNGDYGALYRREYLFRSAGKDYWLPVQAPVAAYFAKELAPGTPVTLYLRNAGGYRSAQGWDWVFLVEEYEGPADAKTPPAKPSAPKPPPAHPGPKLQT